MNKDHFHTQTKFSDLADIPAVQHDNIKGVETCVGVGVSVDL